MKAATFESISQRGIYTSQTSWCGVVWCGVAWNLPNQSKFNYIIIM
jgi:hypothetical protein